MNEEIQKALEQLKIGKSKTIKPEKLRILGIVLQHIQSTMDFKVTRRGWAYILEGAPYNKITKDQFKALEESIDEARKRGFLPLYFTAEDEMRGVSNIEKPTETIDEFIEGWFDSFIDCWMRYDISFWKDQTYYIEMLVEKLDIKELNKNVCAKYHIPIATGRGWADISQRGKMMERFRNAQENGLRPILLYEGDFDPPGLKISDQLRKNLFDIADAVGWQPTDDNLIIERFGLNYNFIEENNLSWINNLITSSGKDIGSSNHIYYDAWNVAEYIEKYGKRKCELNSLVTRPKAGRQLCEDAIKKYLGDDALSKFAVREKAMQKAVRDRIKELGIDEESIRSQLISKVN